MRVLVLGAGGTGGYFGGRLAQAGADVTFLVRPGRARQLDAHGLQIRSPLGDADIPVQHVLAPALPALAQARPFDLVLLSCKAYDLADSIEAIAPAVGPHTTVLPILNGLRHYPPLDARFGKPRVLGGLCFISAMKDADGRVLHLGRAASITFGEREGDTDSARTRELAVLCQAAGIEHLRSPRIADEQWAKFCFLASLAAATCLMRAPVGAIVAAEGGGAWIEGVYGETLAIAQAAGHGVAPPQQQSALKTLTAPDSPLTASMLRDLLAGQPIEGDHIVGDLVHRAQASGLPCPHLATAWVHLQAYDTVRPR